MFFEQYYLGCLAQASYMIGDEESQTAVVVDPRRDVDIYLNEAREHGFQIRYVLLTHFHADFLAGHLELRDRAGAQICLGARAEAEYNFRPLAESDTLQFGKVRLRFLHTPGHTPESISILVDDLAKSQDRPQAVLTGDALFVGDVGRPDLLVSVGMSADELARMLYHSLHDKLLTLPDETVVYPAHGAGSMCGKHLGAETISTIGAQRQFNYALQPMSEDTFVELVTKDQPEAPAYFSYDAVLNRKERPSLDDILKRTLKPIGLADLLEKAWLGHPQGRLPGAESDAQEVQVLDVRPNTEFAGGHLAGSVNIGLAGSFAVWAGAVLDREIPIVIVAEPGSEEEAATRLGRIGFDHVLGYLDGGMQVLAGRPRLIRATQRITVAELAEDLASPNPPTVVDVRRESEWKVQRIDGSRNLPLGQLRSRLAELPRQGGLVVHCAGGYRSSIAVSLLQGAGFDHVVDLIGGVDAWTQARTTPSS